MLNGALVREYPYFLNNRTQRRLIMVLEIEIVNGEIHLIERLEAYKEKTEERDE